MEPATECASCRKPKAVHTCGICEDPICKHCVQNLSADAFAFRKEVPESLKHSRYCGPCFDSEVADELDAYGEVLDRAKEVFVFFTTQRKEIPLIKKGKETFTVTGCADRDETILRLAFFAAEAGYNAVVEVDVSAKKLRQEGYQTSAWQGTGMPAEIDAERLRRQDMQNEQYR